MCQNFSALIILTNIYEPIFPFCSLIHSILAAYRLACHFVFLFCGSLEIIEETDIAGIFSNVRSPLRFVGGKRQTDRPSYRDEYPRRVITSFPGLLEKLLAKPAGSQKLPPLLASSEKVDIWSMFLNSKQRGACMWHGKTIAIGAKALWVQLGVISQSKKRRQYWHGMPVK